MSFLPNSQYFPRSRTLLFALNKMVYFRTFVGNFRKWRHTWHYRTARHSQKVCIHAAQCQIPSQGRVALINRHFYASRTRTARWNSRKNCLLCHVWRHNYNHWQNCWNDSWFRGAPLPHFNVVRRKGKTWPTLEQTFAAAKCQINIERGEGGMLNLFFEFKCETGRC